MIETREEFEEALKISEDNRCFNDIDEVCDELRWEAYGDSATSDRIEYEIRRVADRITGFYEGDDEVPSGYYFTTDPTDRLNEIDYLKELED